MSNNTALKKIELPNLIAALPCSAEAKELLLVAGGRPPSATWLRAVAQNRELHAIDHGLDACFAAKLKPLSLLGDGDSAVKANWQKAAELNIPIEKHPAAKDLTDTELALAKIKAGEENVFILLSGAFGGRLDHLFSNVYSFLHCGLKGCLADEREALFFLRDGEKMELNFSKQPKSISLLPLSAQCRGVSINGVRWQLNNAIISQQLPSTISNELTDINAGCEISLAQGELGVYICFDEA